MYAGLDAIYVRRLLPVLLRLCAPFSHLLPMEQWLAAQLVTLERLLASSSYRRTIFAAVSGLRQGEIFGLSLERIDFETPRLWIDCQVKMLPGAGQICAPPSEARNVMCRYLTAWRICSASTWRRSRQGDERTRRAVDQLYRQQPAPGADGP